MRVRSRVVIFLVSLTTLAIACGPPSAAEDAGMDARCSLEVAIGPDLEGPFVPFTDGDEAEIVLGFQGFQMLLLDVRIEGASAGVEDAEISGYVTIADTGVEAARIDRAAPLTREPDGSLRARGWLLFFNEAPLSAIADHEGELEVVVRAGGCVGGARARLALVDDDPCVDHEIEIPDAASLDGGVADGSIACGAVP